MMATFQQGPLSTQATRLRHVDVEINFNNQWISLNDHYRYELHTQGFGKKSVTQRRKKVSSEFFSGEFTVNEAEANTDERLSIWVKALSQFELMERKDFLVACFKQNPFILRTTINEVRTTSVSSGSADIVIDQSHIFLHNCRALVEVSYSLLPGEEMELIL